MDDSPVLFVVEQRLKALITKDLSSVATRYFGKIFTELRTVPAGSSVLETLSKSGVHDRLTVELDSALERVVSAIKTGYQAAVIAATKTANRKLSGVIKKHEFVTDSSYLNSVISDVEAAFANAKLDIPQSVVAISSSLGQLKEAERVNVLTEAVDRAVRQLGVRVHAAAVVAVHRGYSDAQMAAYGEAVRSQPYLQFVKQWNVTSDSPCPACRALDGISIPLTEEFDHAASDDPAFAPPRVYRDLLAPPRHPNCRCRITLSLSGASQEIHKAVEAKPPYPYAQLTAEQVRHMSPNQFSVLTNFLGTVLGKLKALRRRIINGE